MSLINSFLLLIILGGTILFKTMGSDYLFLLSSGSMVLFLLLTWQKHSLAGKIFISVNIVLILVFWGRGVDEAIIRQGFARVDLFIAFMVALLFLRVAAKKSPIISRCGEFLINQKPSARYAVLSYGSWLIGAVLSFGALNLMGQVISNGNTLESAKGDERIHLIRKKRMVLAMVRGFAALPLSSPFSISMALMLSLIPSLRWQSLLPLSLSVAFLLIALGWVMDYRAYAYARSRVPEVDEGKRDIASIFSFILIILALFGSAASLSQFLGYGLPTSILMLSPVFGVVWFLLEGRAKNANPFSGINNFWKELKTELNGMAAEVAIIGGASFLGALTAAIVPVGAVQSFSETLFLQGYPLALFCMAAVMLTSLVGVSPFVSVSILGATFSNVAVFGLSPYVLAISLLMGWFLALNASPLTISAIMVGRILQCRPRDITLFWNGRYSLCALVLSGALLYIFHHFYD